MIKQLVAVGACYLDTILSVDHYPVEDEKLRASGIFHRRGGNCPNTLEVLQQLLDFQRVETVSLILSAVLPSKSSAGTQKFESSFGPRIDLTHCIYREDFNEPASSYITKSRSTGSRTIVNYNELPEMTYEEFIIMVGRLDNQDSWFHFEGRIPEVVLDCMRYLRQNYSTVKISVEVEKPGRGGLQALAAEADVVFYSKTWAQGNGFQSPEECLRAQSSLTPRASLLCCTWGQDGASALELPGLKYIHSPAFTAIGLTTVDTIGAGDTFIAGMLYGLICHRDHWTLTQRLNFANELAGRKVAQEGFSGLASDLQHSL